MLIKKIAVSNLRCCKDIEIECRSIVGLIGKNDTGKSTALEGIKTFFQSSRSFSSDDYYDDTKPIEIKITFFKLHNKELGQFQKYYDNDELTLTRIESLNDGVHFLGNKPQISEFIEIRRKTYAKDRLKAYKDLYEKKKYDKLPSPDSSWSRLEEKLQEYEEKLDKKKTKLTPTEMKFIQNSLFGEEVASEETKTIFIPALYDIANEINHTNGIIQQIFKDFINSKIEQDLEFKDKLVDVKNEIEDLYKKKRSPLHKEFLEKLNNSLKRYAVDLKCSIKMDEITPNIRFPQPKIIFESPEITTKHEKQGMGTQRSILFGLFDFWAQITHELSANSSNPNKLDIIMLIEEPEIYIHPSKCKFLFELFKKLTRYDDKNLVNFQIIYTTHSPYFISIQDYESIKIFRKNNITPNLPPFTSIAELEQNQFINEYCSEFSCDRSIVTEQSIWIRHLSKITSSFNQGFFADKIVLVEGKSDLSYYFFLQNQMGYNADNKNISFIKVNGKEILKYFSFLFSLFKIPIYLIWDGDIHNKGKSSTKSGQKNKELLKMIGEVEVDFPNDSIYDKGAIFEDTIEVYISSILGDIEFNRIKIKLINQFNLHGYSNLEKNAEFAYKFVEKVYSEGHTLPFLEGILKRIFC